MPMLDSLSSDNSQLEPPNIYIEGTWLYGAFVTCILYGITVILYAVCVRSLWRRIRSHTDGRKKQWFLFIYVHIIFGLDTLYAATTMQITQLSFIDHRDFPGGPSAYESHVSPTPMNLSFVFANWCADALMIWRCHIVYRDSKYHLFVTGFGCLMLAASIVTGSMWAILVSPPTQPMSWMALGFNLFFPYLSVSLGINIVICALTVLRLLYYRACISKAFGPEYGVLYASFAAMIVESAAVYSISSLFYLIPYAMNDPIANVALQILGESQIIGALLIIYRVSEGKAWTRDIARRLATTGSYALRELVSESTPATSQPPRQSGTQVVLPGTHQVESGGSDQPTLTGESKYSIV